MFNDWNSRDIFCNSLQSVSEQLRNFNFMLTNKGSAVVTILILRDRKRSRFCESVLNKLKLREDYPMPAKPYDQLKTSCSQGIYFLLTKRQSWG